MILLAGPDLAEFDLTDSEFAFVLELEDQSACQSELEVDSEPVPAAEIVLEMEI